MKLARCAFVALVFTVAAIPAAGVAKTQPPALACGDVVTQSVRLKASLTGCSTGLIVGADGVTIDLHGYSIEGIGGEGVGVDVTGRSDVTVGKGEIRGFATGVLLRDTMRAKVTSLTVTDTQTAIWVVHVFNPPSLDANEVSRNNIVGAVTGIQVFGGGDRIERNTIGAATSNGIFLRGNLGPPGAFVAHNQVTQSGVGILQFDCLADLVGNWITGNTGSGIVVSDSHGTVVNNTVNGNGGSGILGVDAHAQFLGNVTNGNAGHGLLFGDNFGPHGPFLEVTRHTANDNGGYGIFTSLEGVVDGGKNRAHGNGNTPQCVGVVCK